MTSRSRLRIPDVLSKKRSTWMEPPARTATIDIRDRYTEGYTDPVVVTGSIVHLGSIELLQYTYLDPAQLAEVEAEVAAFNAEPDAVWGRLLGDLAERRMAGGASALADTSKLTALAAVHLPKPAFEYLTIDLECAEEVARYNIHPGEAVLVVDPFGGRRGSVQVVAESGLGYNIELYSDLLIPADQESLRSEVERFNAHPLDSLRTIARDALLVEYRRTADEIAGLASRQCETVDLLGRIA